MATVRFPQSFLFLSGWVLLLACEAFLYGSASLTEEGISYQLEKKQPGSIWISVYPGHWTEITEDSMGISLPQRLLIPGNLKHAGLYLCFSDVYPNLNTKQPDQSTVCLDLFQGKAAKYLQKEPNEFGELVNTYFITGIIYEDGIIHTVREYRAFLHSIFIPWRHEKDYRYSFIDAGTESKQGGKSIVPSQPEIKASGFVAYNFRALWLNRYEFVFSVGDIPERTDLEKRQWRTLLEMNDMALPAPNAVYPTWYHRNVLLLCYRYFHPANFHHKIYGCYNMFHSMGETRRTLQEGKYYVNLVEFYPNGFHHTIIESKGNSSGCTFKYFFFRSLQRLKISTRVARYRKRRKQHA